ncbi:MAG: glycolate oxidase subunit GlcE [Litorivicinaceae bacterium]
MTDFVAEVSARLKAGQSIEVIGAGSRRRVGPPRSAHAISTRSHSGVIRYEPTELVLTANAGTPLADIEAMLAAERQMLAFEPPRFSADSTLGGAVASGLAGPRRVAMGGIRDHILGVRLINGLGEHLRFGGEVMKNVAGFDVSRLQVGAFGQLGVLTEVSIKVLPVPEVEETRHFQCGAEDALAHDQAWGRQPLPISASHWREGSLFVRVSGTERGVTAAVKTLGGDAVTAVQTLWQGVRDLTDSIFSPDEALWRLAVPPTTVAKAFPVRAMDWHGGQRWTTAPAGDLSPFAWAAAVGGHARCESLDRPTATWQQALPAGVARLNERVRRAMDPQSLINPTQQG